MRFIGFAAAAFAALLLSGCNQAEIKEERARLELAEVKGDLDQMYLSLKRLADKGDKAAQTRLPDIAASIRARETMLTAVNDRDHEQAVIAASDFLKLSDKNKDAIKVLRESGQILYLLRKAQGAIAAYRELEPSKIEVVAFDVTGARDSSERSRLVTQAAHTALAEMGLAAEDGRLSAKAKKKLEKVAADKKIAFNGVISEDLASAVLEAAAEHKTKAQQERYVDSQYEALSQARQAVRRAREIDPQFKGSVQLEDILEEVHNALVQRSVSRVRLHAELAFITARVLYSTTLQGLNDAASSRYSNVQEMWNKLSPLMNEAHEDIRTTHLANLSREAKRLSTYRSGSMSALAETTVKFSSTVDTSVRRLMDPAGSLLDYRAVGPAVQTEFDRFKAELAAGIPSDVDGRARSSMERLSMHKLFRHAETEAIIKMNEALFSL